MCRPFARIARLSRRPLEQDSLAVPDFDSQFPANIVAARLPTLDLRILGLRVPWYERSSQLLRSSWAWLEVTTAALRKGPAVILGDLNVSVSSGNGDDVVSFRRILESGWQRAVPPVGCSYFGHSRRRSEIDHIVATPYCRLKAAEYVTAVRGFTLAGTPDALSDHAALAADIEVR
jgi:endonuclease/exonuclease/phosphatase family metal-dependent hydrolase